ncbi:unnamed protein product [Lota lota]
MDKFTVLGILGEGAYGTVMKCRNSINGQVFAVKKFVPLRRQEMSNTIAMEFTLLARLQHDNLIKVMSKFTEKSRLHCVFELMDHSICEDMEQQPQGLESQLLRKYTFQILCGMEYLHSVNVLHRDIKPANLLVSRSGVVKVADLGLGRVLDANRDPSLTLSIGTLWFLSPEALTGGLFLSKSHDVWAIGCTILAMAKSTAFIMGLTFLEQLLMVVSKVGHLTVQQQQGFLIEYPGCNLPAPALPPGDPQQKYRLCDPLLAQLVEASLQMDPDSRATCSELLGQQYFTWDSFHQRFSMELAEMVQADQHGASLTQLMDQPQTTDIPICPSGCLDPDTVGPHESSCSPEIPPEIRPEIPLEILPEIHPEIPPEILPDISPDISEDITSEAASVKRKGRCGAGFLRVMRNIRGFFTACCSPNRE